MQTNEKGDALGVWLLKQVKREDWIGTLALQAKGDHFEALDDAEVEWLSE